MALAPIAQKELHFRVTYSPLCLAVFLQDLRTVETLCFSTRMSFYLGEYFYPGELD